MFGQKYVHKIFLVSDLVTCYELNLEHTKIKILANFHHDEYKIWPLEYSQGFLLEVGGAYCFWVIHQSICKVYLVSKISWILPSDQYFEPV